MTTFDHPILDGSESVEVLRLAARDAAVSVLQTMNARPAGQPPASASPEEYLAWARSQAGRPLGGDVERIERFIRDEQVFAQAADMLERHQIAVRRDEAIYRPGGEHSLIADLLRSEHNSAARERIARSNAQIGDEYRARGIDLRDTITRDSDTSNFAGLVPPVYLTTLMAPGVRAGRPTADALNNTTPLPATGMQVQVGRLTTPTAAAVVAQNVVVTEANADDTIVTGEVTTIAGIADISYPLAMRSDPATLDFLYGDLVRAYNTALGSAVVNSAAATGAITGLRNVSGLISVSYTDASPTLGELLPKLADAYRQMTNGLGMPPEVMVMTPTRWAWAIAALDAQGHPMVERAGRVNDEAPTAANNWLHGRSPGELLPGLPVILDPNIPVNLGAGTNEDVILLLRASELYLFEDPAGPLLIKPDRRQSRIIGDPGPNAGTGSRLLVQGQAAMVPRYANAIAVVSGTGLVQPTF